MTPPMTLVDWEWEHHHQCDEANCRITEEALFPAFDDWTLFPEVPPIIGPNVPSSVIRAKTPVADRKEEVTKSQKKRHQLKASKSPREVTSKLSIETKLSDDDEIMHGAPSQSVEDWRQIELLDSPSPTILGFEPVPRTSTSLGSLPFDRIPTPPVESMGELFAPIEALGEDLRQYQATRKVPEPSQKPRKEGAGEVFGIHSPA